jgi:hypothetical protein
MTIGLTHKSNIRSDQSTGPRQARYTSGAGQYRSCIFLPPTKAASDKDTEAIVRQALKDCQSQLQRELSTEFSAMGSSVRAIGFGRPKNGTRDTTSKGASARLTIFPHFLPLIGFRRMVDAVSRSSDLHIRSTAQLSSRNIEIIIYE